MNKKSGNRVLILLLVVGQRPLVALFVFSRELDFRRMVKAVITVGMDVASANFAFANHLRRNSFKIIGQSNSSHGIYKHRGQIEAPAQFGCGIVPWKCVMIVVEAFTNGAIHGKEVFRWIYVLIIWMSSPEMRRRVHTPSHVERECISEECTDVEGVVQ